MSHPYQNNSRKKLITKLYRCEINLNRTKPPSFLERFPGQSDAKLKLISFLTRVSVSQLNPSAMQNPYLNSKINVSLMSSTTNHYLSFLGLHPNFSSYKKYRNDFSVFPPSRVLNG